MKKNSLRTSVIAIVGPTASGKTSYSIELAKSIDGEIISADSRLVYKEFNIGSAKPTFAEMDGVPHHMIDIVTPDVNYSAGLFKEQAENCISDIINRGKTPIICGGTGLYINILLMGYELPRIAPDYDLRKKLNNLSKEELFDYLSKLDPDTAIDKNDSKKIIRAIEIMNATGKTLSRSRGLSDSKYDIEWIGLNYERDVLYNRINQRVDDMMDKGLVSETEYLIEKYGPIANIIETIGYKEMYDYINGSLAYNSAVELLKKNTRNYAKRQLTWFRKNSNIKWNVYPEKLLK